MKILLLLCVSAVVVALFASTALAQTSNSASPTASVTATAGSTAAATISAAASVSPSATATATASASALSKTGGPSYILPVTVVASLALVLSGLAALRLTVRRGAS
jgi:hypothetical protein